MVDKVAKILPSLEKEFGRAQEIGKIVDVEGKEMFEKVKEEIIKLLYAKYEVESKRMVRILNKYIMELYNHIFSFLSYLITAQAYRRPSPPSIPSKLVCHPHNLHCWTLRRWPRSSPTICSCT